jgi:uncharacterized protein
MKEHEIFSAIYRNDLESVKEFTRDRTVLEVRDRAGRTPLINAALGGKVELLHLLLSLGADCNASDKAGFTPLHFAAQDYLEEIANLLIDHGAVVDARDEHGNTPLGKAVFNSRGRGEIIKLLRDHDADPRATNKHGVSPLSLSKTIANYPVAQFFDDVQDWLKKLDPAKSVSVLAKKLVPKLVRQRSRYKTLFKSEFEALEIGEILLTRL